MMLQYYGHPLPTYGEHLHQLLHKLGGASWLCGGPDQASLQVLALITEVAKDDPIIIESTLNESPHLVFGSL